MSDEKVYEAFRETLVRAGGAIPAIPNEALYRLLRELADPREAAFANSLPDGWVSAEAQAQTLGRPREEVEAMLETMTNKGLLHARKTAGGGYEYRTMALLPGVYEMQFFRGTKTDRDYRLAKLFKDYFDSMNKIRDSLPGPPKPPKTSYFRVLPVEKEIESPTKVLPFSKISKYVEKTEAIAVGTCFCRHHAILLDEKDHCGVAHNNCMAFGEGALFVADRGMGRLVSKEEAVKILERAEEEGLVHCTANTSEELVFICNCCTCHCGILRMAKGFPQPSRFLTSGYTAWVDAELCTACETCLERCPLGAITVEETANVDAERCIGCGLCAETCPSEAIELSSRPEVKVPPKKLGDLERQMKAG